MARSLLVSDMMRSYEWDFDSEDKKSVAAHAAKMHVARKLVSRGPLIPGLDFLCKNIPRIANIQGARPVPSFAQVTEGIDSREPETILLRLVRSLFTGTGSLQGSMVPYFLGVQKLKTPSGEMAYALLLEYIEGLTLHQLFEGEEFQKTKEHMDPKGFSQACNMYKLVMKSLDRFHAIDFYNRNVSPRNVILPSSANEVVFIDFSFGDRPRDQSDVGKNSEKYQMHHRFVDAMICGEDVVNRAGKSVHPEHLPILWSQA